MKRPKINPELERPLQDYANAHFDGNVTKAINSIIAGEVLSHLLEDAANSCDVNRPIMKGK